MEVKLLSYTKDALECAISAMKTCYSEQDPETIFKNLNTDDEKEKDKLIKFVDKVLSSGHLSTIEHINFTFGIKDISRACSHQLVRHRHCSFSHQSQRYVRFDNPHYYEPIDILKNRKADAIYNDILTKINIAYQELIELGINQEDARYVLSNATCSNMTITINLRELIHICNLRLCSRAQTEIRTLTKLLAKEVINVLPWTEKYLVPNCEKDGFCKEKNCCGRKPTLEQFLKN